MCKVGGEEMRRTKEGEGWLCKDVEEAETA